MTDSFMRHLTEFKFYFSISVLYIVVKFKGITKSFFLLSVLQYQNLQSLSKNECPYIKIFFSTIMYRVYFNRIMKRMKINCWDLLRLVNFWRTRRALSYFVSCTEEEMYSFAEIELIWKYFFLLCVLENMSPKCCEKWKKNA